MPDAGSTTPYTRFIVLSKGRTGSTMLIEALNSHPHVRCFGSVFHRQHDFVDFSVPGYDNEDPAGLRLRNEDPIALLHQRVFGTHGPDVRAVGFKYRYGAAAWFPGLQDQLIADRELRVVHLQRHNLLRSLVSARIAQDTGAWFDRAKQRPGKLRPRTLLRAARHPLRVAERLRRPAAQPRPSWKDRREPITISLEECAYALETFEQQAREHDALFHEHPMLAVWYEDLAERRDETLEQVQGFLGLEPRRLTVTLRKQNPEPLRELIANYDELAAALRPTRYAAFLDG